MNIKFNVHILKHSPVNHNNVELLVNNDNNNNNKTIIKQNLMETQCNEVTDNIKSDSDIHSFSIQRWCDT